MTITATLNVDRPYEDGEKTMDREIECFLTGEYTPEEKGSRNEYGVPMEPDWPSRVDLISCMDSDGNEVELTDQEYGDAVHNLWEAIPEKQTDFD